MRAPKDIVADHLQAGLVVYGSLLATSAYKHCGFHAWDLTVADLHQANYVGFSSQHDFASG